MNGFFPNYMEKYMTISFFHLINEKIMFYTEILTQKVELWIFSTCVTHDKTPQNNFSCQNFSIENNYF